jgi:hypothetical protein
MAMRSRGTRESSEEVRASVERVELLTALVSAFAQPIPEYEPEFHHLPDRLSAHELHSANWDSKRPGLNKIKSGSQRIKEG